LNTGQYKILLPEKDLPRRWYNIQADLPLPLDPPLNPSTRQPAGPGDLSPIFPPALIEQEMTQKRWIDIPEEVLAIYRLWRPTPLVRAHRLEQALQTPARIYYKNEGVSPAGSHKTNTAVPQAYYNKQAGVKRIASETGAGQWGSALALACTYFGLECAIYMVNISYRQKPYRRSLMEVWGAQVFASPSALTQTGRRVLAENPESPGSLGIAISEAVEDAAGRADTNYALGSVLNHVLLHQSVIGLECLEQFQLAEDYPDLIIGCCGGGSNFGGIAFPFLHEKIRKGTNTRIIAVEPSACPTLTKGAFTYDFGDVACYTPLLKMYTLGHDFVPPGIHAGGLRYHGESPLVSRVYHDGLAEAKAYSQTAVFEAAVTFARTEGILPAPESAHAICAAIESALECKATGEAKSILFGLSGHGHFDLTAYDAYLSGNMEDFEYPRELVEKSIAKLPQIG
jgi:tryptophan synthase beta chain